MSEIVIWGCGGHAREMNLLCEQSGHTVIGFLDERREMKGKVVDDVPVLGDLEDIHALQHKVEIVCAGVGEPSLKKRLVAKTIEAGFKLSNALVHPSVYVSKRNSVGIGSVICAGSILTVNIEIGNFVIINRGSNISHENIIGDFVTIGPGVNIAGNVTIEEGAKIGIGSSIREKIKIGPWSVIGGGAFVKEDVPPKTLYAGVPATYKKSLI
ncbi:acetyltransferase [Aneurinibacillus sp. Ricciae_BoGa-3]|uniref:acetyltransferase n=1 Tax=Aneurinibacillus sp. Ricciae_BoGa-3 TaxID=3022697 RepID=UPI00234035C4|nr:acetyltransferase [Aneurinibacillus sp. Ricciae_BoGa-3]WCK56176.1 acetyltransferase [Aneurinibacillus sp. Ricciae_BoGa-3]